MCHGYERLSDRRGGHRLGLQFLLVIDSPPPLSGVEEPNAEADVPVHELTMTATATEKGVVLRPAKARLIDKSAPRKKQPQAPTDGEESEDSLDGLMPPDSIPSSNGSVDTDVEDDDDLADEEGHEEKELAAAEATSAEVPELGAWGRAQLRGRATSARQTYLGNSCSLDKRLFLPSDKRDQQYLRIVMYGHWGRDDQMGKYNLSKQLVPAEFDEGRNDPRRTKVVLRAWAL